MERLKYLLAPILLSTLAWPAWAMTYRLPPQDEDLVGKVAMVEVREGETLIDIAREHGLGYNEVVAANPGLDPWVPPTGAEVVLPTRYILPSGPRSGIIINIAEMRLYYYPAPAPDGSGMVMTFPIGIGQEGWDTPLGITRIVSKAEDPPWVVPASVRREHEADGTPLPAVVPPGPDNPLGRHALRLGWTSYLIHGTNKPFGIGMRVSHGCIRMYPEHVERLYHMVKIDTPVWIIDQPVKIGRSGGELFVEAHPPTSQNAPPADHLSTVLAVVDAVTVPEEGDAAREAAHGIATRLTGVPEPVGRLVPPTTTAVDARGWVLQLGAFADGANAARLARELADVGMPVSVMAHDNGLCHVLVGPYAEHSEAMVALEGYRRDSGRDGGEVLPAERPGMLGECVLAGR
ncbi:MAG: L,D-transpeptidase family protein [Gammaproteobacteria bacterium]|jgi:L,D-transpeptidase ErfK/SrfK|nr:L,D-transpeptidase family protein [Gammaproteobacteria bacterium]